MAHTVSRIEIEQSIDDDGDLRVRYETSDGMTYIEMIGLMEMTKLTMNEEALRPTDED